MHYESKHWDLVANKCQLHGELKPGVGLSTQVACATCVGEHHPGVAGIYPVQLSEDSPMKHKMMLDAYVQIVKAKLERKGLWRALTYWQQFDTFVEFQYNGCQTEKQCVRAIRRALINADRISHILMKECVDRCGIECAFIIVLNGVLQGHEEAAIMERAKCSPRSKVL